MSRDHRKPSRYNQQFFRDWGGAGPLTVGLIAAVLVAVGFYLAFTKSIPFTSPGYQVNATFTNAVNIAINSPIRIAGINVGKVTEVSAAGEATLVTFSLDEEGRPIREDAAAQIRPRLFLEGNWFIDLDPGTPDAEEMPDEGVIPVTRTGTSVQVGDVLRNTLQLPQRANLQKVLAGLGTGLNATPTPAEDLTFEPSVRGLSGGEALNLLYREGEVAARGTAIVNAAYLGENPNELRNLLRGLGRLTGTVNARADDVQGFVRNFATFTGALAAESESLSETIRELPPTLTTARTSLSNLNRALPALRGFAIAITPGVNEIPETIRAVRPLANQLKPLLTESELLGLTRIIKNNTPATTTSARATLALLPQLQYFGLCVAGNIVPTGDQVITDGGLGNGQKASRQALYSAVNVAGSTSTFDGNGPFIRFQVGGGTEKVQMPDPLVGGILTPLYGRTPVPTLGTSPLDLGTPPLVTDQPCYTQDVPDLNSPAAVGPGPASPEVTP
jgi:phospholipid/cholesterol/gamma-HCH transport system substrate-binding protein